MNARTLTGLNVYTSKPVSSRLILLMAPQTCGNAEVSENAVTSQKELESFSYARNVVVAAASGAPRPILVGRLMTGSTL